MLTPDERENNLQQARKKNRDMQLKIRKYNRSGGEEHSRDEELDNLENKDAND